MMARQPTALIAEDEPLLRRALLRMLAEAWPELEVIAQARNGREAIELFDRHQPALCFLDVQMPGLSGVEVARHIGRRARIVFVTAFDQYAVQAFDQGAVDYLVKPVETARLRETVARLRERMQEAGPAAVTDAMLEKMAAWLDRAHGAPTLRWLRVSLGEKVHLVSVDEIDYLRSESKYTRVAWRGDRGRDGRAMVRTPLKELLEQLDAGRFVQVHRSVVVNLEAVSHVTRGANETARIHLRDRTEVLPVSAPYLHLFRQM